MNSTAQANKGSTKLSKLAIRTIEPLRSLAMRSLDNVEPDTHRWSRTENEQLRCVRRSRLVK